MRQQILAGTEHTLSIDFGERPVAASGCLYDKNNTLQADLSACDLGVNLTVSGTYAVTDADRRVIGLSSTTGLTVGTTYKLINSEQSFEFVTLRSIPASRLCAIDKKLTFAYSTGDSLVSPKVEYTIPSASTVKGDNYRAHFVALLSNGKRVWKDLCFDVVNHVYEQAVTSSNLRTYDPTLWRHLPTEERGTDWQQALNTAHDLTVEAIHAKGINHVLGEEQLARLQMFKFRGLLAEMGVEFLPGKDCLELIRFYNDEFIAELDRVTTSLRWNDENDDLTEDAAEGEVAPRFELGI